MFVFPFFSLVSISSKSSTKHNSKKNSPTSKYCAKYSFSLKAAFKKISEYIQ